MEGNPEQPREPEPAIGETVPEREAHRVVALEEPKIAEALSAAFGLDISIEQKVTSGYESQVYECTVNGEKAFVLMNKRKGLFPAEIEAYSLLEEHGIPVPKVIAYEEAPAQIDCPTLILSAARGTPIAESVLSSEQQAAVYEELGSIQRRINAIPVEGFGFLTVHEGTLKGEFDSWKGSWEAEQPRFQRCIDSLRENGLLSEDELSALMRANEELGALDISGSFMQHRDLHRAHVFLEDGKISGVIDLGKLSGGDPRHDIADTYIFLNDAQRAAFVRGYGEAALDPIIDRYIMLIAGYKIVFRYKNGNAKGLETVTRAFRKASARTEA